MNPDQIQRRREFLGRAREKSSICGAAFRTWIGSPAADLPTIFSLKPAGKSRAIGICSKAGWAISQKLSLGKNPIRTDGNYFLID
jgi:hypothetical protein